MLPFTLLAAMAMIVGISQPAVAGWNDGDVFNRASSNYTIKVAMFGTGSSWCSTWNAGGFSCQHYWLPSGMADDSISPPGWNDDVDGFMVENAQYLLVYPTWSRWVSAGTWTRIANGTNVNCANGNGSVTCTVTL